VNASYVGKDFDDNKIALLEPIAEQLLWLNLARTGITDKGIATLEKYTLLTRLHLENTSISDAATVHLSKLSNLEYLNLYATQVSDVSVPYLQKIDQLKKIFLWQTKITPQGAEALRRHFVDAGEYDSLMAQKKVFKTSLDNLINTEELKFQKLEQDLLQASAITKDKEVINKKCPVTQKSIDPSKISIFEGRKIGFCCDKCKSKFDADGAVFRSKIKDFKASDEFLALVENMQNARLSKDNTIETSQQKLRILTGKLSKMGPQINLGFNKPVVSK
jgi:Leucine-rich repeat (LRR) protein